MGKKLVTSNDDRDVEKIQALKEKRQALFEASLKANKDLDLEIQKMSMAESAGLYESYVRANKDGWKK